MIDAVRLQQARERVMSGHRIALCGVALLAVVSMNVLGQNYPAKSLRLVIPFPPGGGSDFVGRIVGQKLGDALGQGVVADNRPGAAGIVGTEVVAKALPDGYTLLLASGSHSINASFGRRLPYDPLRDFAPASRIGLIPNMLVVHPGVAAVSVTELVALAKSRPGGLNYASAGKGSTQHLAMELFKAAASVDLTHVPYKGAAPAEIDILAGRVQVMFATVPAVLLHAKSGRLRALAIGSARRSPLVPDLPTVAESGVPGYEVDSWYGLLAPAGTPKPVLTRLNKEVNALITLPEIRDRFAALGAQAVGGSPEEFATFIKTEIAKWIKLGKESRIEME